ncbi:MAG: hypothetical protein JWM11_741 [Planctomycetaceae bacterium]|nr:hypothetical protein [Planctomycetaceae bacterium]
MACLKGVMVFIAIDVPSSGVVNGTSTVYGTDFEQDPAALLHKSHWSRKFDYPWKAPHTYRSISTQQICDTVIISDTMRRVSSESIALQDL